MIDEQELIYALAFTIEDPLDNETLHFTRALVEFARMVQPKHRHLVTDLFRSIVNEVREERKTKQN